MVCAGYALYGDATVVMLSFGEEVHGFTLDPSIGEFVLTHKNVKIPEAGKVYSINEGYAEEWDDAVKAYVSMCKKPMDKTPAKKLVEISLFDGIFEIKYSKWHCCCECRDTVDVWCRMCIVV